jgi:RNA recognition motif-containing protein
MGNGRMGSNAMGPNSYNRDRDQDRGTIPCLFYLIPAELNELICLGEKERAPSRDSTEEIGEWRHQNGDGNRERDREFRRYDDNLQVFVGNIPHSATEEMLKVRNDTPRDWLTFSNRDNYSQELFQQFGNVVDVRIQGKGIRLQNGGGRAPAPYYGFVVFDAPEAAEAALAKKVTVVLLFSSM